MNIPILEELIIILAASLLVIFISQKLRLPVVTGFLVTGIIIGPSGLKLVKNLRSIDSLAEIGVVMLLFTIGLEFSLRRLKEIRKNFFFGGSLQVLATTVGVIFFLQFFHLSLFQSLFYGFLISLSSTAVVLKIYSDRGELDSPHGKIALAILLFQDFGLVPMIILTPLLGENSFSSLWEILLRFSIGALVLGVVILFARHLMPCLLHLIVRTRVREAFLFTSLFLCLGMAYLTFAFDFSLALGAFIAGIILSESEYSHQVVSDILPYKDLFSSLFFVSVGMLLNLKFAWGEKLFILALAASIFFLKAIVLFLILMAMKQIARVALLVSFALAQIGEFSFVLARVGKSYGLIPENLFQGFIASSILTIIATPLLIQLSPLLAQRIEKIRPKKTASLIPALRVSENLVNHVIIAGFGLNGQNLARVLKGTGIPYAILDLNPETVKKAHQEGEPILFGDISNREILKLANIQKAKVIVFAISDPGATRRGVKIAKELNPDLYIIVRTRYVTEIDELYKLGANQVIPEEFETSIEIFTRTLEEFHIPRNLIDAQTKIIRSERYEMFRGPSKTPRSLEKIMDLLAAGTADTFYINKDSPAAGKSLGELNLRKETGATVIAIVRGEKSFTGPPVEFKIEEGDTLVLVGSHQDMDRAFRFLS